jgi:uncharacterized protein with PQ loop repeat
MFFTALSWVAASFTAGFSLMQLRTTVRERNVSGISTLSWCMQVLVAGLWISYGLHNAMPQQLLANLPLVLTTTVIGWFHRQRLRAALPTVVLAGSWAVGFVAADLPGWLGTPLGMFFAVPQLVKALRDGRAEGVSMLAWVSQSTASTLWLVFGLAEGEAPLIVTASVQSALCWATTAVLLQARPAHR